MARHARHTQYGLTSNFTKINKQCNDIKNKQRTPEPESFYDFLV